MTLFEFDSNLFSCLIRQFEFLFWIFIFSMYLELLAPNLFSLFFGFLDHGSSRSAVMVNAGGAISGLAYEKRLCSVPMQHGIRRAICKAFRQRIYLS